MGTPVVAASLDGRLEVFVVVGDGTIRHIWQFPDGSFSNWFNHGKTSQAKVLGFGQPAVERNADGRLELFASDEDSGLLYHKWQLVPNGGWSDWAAFPKPGNGAGDPAAILDSQGRLQVFTAKESMYQIWQLSPNSGWSQWLNHGAEDGGFGGAEVHHNQDGRVEVFAVTQAVNLYHKWQLRPSGWSNWVLLTSGIRGVVVGSSLDGRMEAFGVSGSDSLLHVWQLVPNGNWSQVFDHGIRGGGFNSNPTVAPNQDGRLELRIAADDGFVWGKSQLVANGQWGDWFHDSPQGISSGPTLFRNHLGLLFLFVFGANGQLFFKSQTALNGSWSDWASLGEP